METVKSLGATYHSWLDEIKQQIRVSKIKVAMAANAELLKFYWELGKSISEKLKSEEWGSKVIDVLSADLRNEFSDAKGFSRQNLYFMKQFYDFYSTNIIVSQSGRQLQSVDYYSNIFNVPWGGRS